MEARDIIKTPGNVAKIKAATGINANTITYWGRRNRIPAEHVPAVATALEIPRHEIRPDLYDHEPHEGGEL